jgi:hypothetical protein
MRFLYQRAFIQEARMKKRVTRVQWKPSSDVKGHTKRSRKIADLESRAEFYRNEMVTYTCNGEFRAAQEMKTTALLEAYSKMVCQQACHGLFASSLPRELRDMVYELIIGDSDVIITGAFLKKLHPLASPMVFEDYTFDPWCWSEDFMGREVLEEYIERWYAVTQFTINEFCLIPELLKNPRPTLSIDPKALVSKVQVRLWNWSSPGQLAVDDLLKFKNGVHIKLKIESTALNNYRGIWQSTDSQIERFVSKYSYMFSTLCQLKESGSRIEATVDDECLINPENAELSQTGWVNRIKEFRQVWALLRDVQHQRTSAKRTAVFVRHPGT